ncbi:LysE family transporter [Bacillus subtilis]|uniref:LysE family transporter n=1 Tax=Bacillus subtilis TaxID=1423 RepID=UPI000D85BB4F|nr:LysE family transporter [Bacillus subtilis]MCM3189198.1 LysE family translocator [Bacillus subtilis]MCW0121124.1 LysE family translocator [Bacillus subtilis]MDP0483675.1 LysE family transporter [Bacillus subtilis]MEC2265395.1 LysE family transporter [Bacillus subtilis]MED1758988.1 LysE family transporter [Bacillus subtilis]
MISSILSYILLGISLSAPVGPINVAQIKKGLANGFLSAWLVGVGAMFADVMMMLLIYFGVASFLTNSIAQLIMWLFGFVILSFLGYESVKDASKSIEFQSEQSLESPFKSFLSGFLIAASNPLNIIFWIGIYGSVLTKNIESIGREQALWYSSAIFIGIMIWDLTMATAVHFGRKKLNQKMFKWVSIIAGIVLIGFGLSFLYQSIMIILKLI